MIRILIADDHGIVRTGLKLLLDRMSEMEVVGEASDGREAWEPSLWGRLARASGVNNRSEPFIQGKLGGVCYDASVVYGPPCLARSSSNGRNSA